MKNNIIKDISNQKENITSKHKTNGIRIQKATRILATILITFGILFTNTNLAKAASATASFNATEETIAMGDEFTVTMTVAADLNIGSMELYIIYDDSVAEFQTGGSKISGGNGLLRVSDSDFEEESASKKYAMTFKAIDAGSFEIKMSEDPLIYDLDNGAAMSISSNSLTVSINNSVTLSKNTNLKSLKVSPGKLNPEFSTTINKYSITVPAETKKITVSATPEDENAKVTVTGAKELTEGDNKITITVKSQSGEKKEYTINVIRETEASPSPSPEELLPTTSPIPNSNTPIPNTDLTVVVEEGKTYLQNTYRYQLAEVKDSSLIPSGYIKTKLILYGVTISAYTLEDDFENDFLLIYAINQAGEPDFYQYDREEKTLQRYNGKIIQSSTESDNTKVFTSDTYRDRVNQLAIIIAILSSIIALLTIAFIRIILKHKDLKDDDLD